MNEQEVRAMIRESIARQTGAPAPARSAAAAGGPDAAAMFHAHVSHLRFPIVRGSDDDGACIIEPAVRCNHCGFCLSYGH
jgi:hypothetical protein